MSRDAWPGDDRRPQSLNGWSYVESDPVDKVDPSGMTASRPPGGQISRVGVCQQPAPERASLGVGDLGVWKGNIYIYCGDFDLTAYQVIQDIGYDSLPTPVPSGSSVPKGQPTDIPQGMVRGQIEGAGAFLVRSEFATDVEINGSGQSSRAPCTGGYFSDMEISDRYADGSPRSFSASCGTGRNINPVADAYRAAASDPNQVPTGAVLHIMRMVVPDPRSNPPSGKWVQSDTVTALDTGSRITGYRLDIFVGQGRGERSFSNFPDPPLNTWANIWSMHQPGLRLAVYQRVPPANPVHAIYKAGGLCDIPSLETEEGE